MGNHIAWLCSGQDFLILKIDIEYLLTLRWGGGIKNYYNHNVAAVIGKPDTWLAAIVDFVWPYIRLLKMILVIMLLASLL